ncbi:MAG: acyltransferase [Prevotella sp.]|nr:acyltransferase [Prevotella sp.]MBO5613685.1 acyltransferase [Prevotella sp.]
MIEKNQTVTDKKARINWLSILRGLTILLVVMFHVRLTDKSTGECYAFILEIGDWFSSIRMPTFVMISGMLLYYTRISKGWSNIALYKDKFIRIGLPLIFCTCLGNLLQIAYNRFSAHPHEVNVLSFLKSFFVVDNMPWPHRWYLMVLMTMMFLYPLYCRILKNKWFTILFLAILIFLEPFNFYQDVETNWFYFFSLNRFLPYFFIGILISKYKLWKKVDKWYLVPVLWGVYIILYAMHQEFFVVRSLVGMGATIATALLIDKYIPMLCSSYRKYIFQIYLFGIAFQALIGQIVWKGLGYPDSLVVVFYLVNIVVGIYIPVLMSKIIERIPYSWIRLCFGLK